MAGLHRALWTQCSAMSGWAKYLREVEKERRRLERDAKQRQKELERELKAQAKRSAVEQAQLEVEAYENGLAVLLSIHKDASAPFDWISFASAPAPHAPLRFAHAEFTALLQNPFVVAAGDDSSVAAIASARNTDEVRHAEALGVYQQRYNLWERTRDLAQRVLGGHVAAYREAVQEFATFGELEELGSSIHLHLQSAKLIECTLTVNGRHVIPAEIKAMSSSGKLSVKAMPKARFHEIYQDYVCSCVLRLAREVFALLPLETVLITAVVKDVDPSTGHDADVPILSVIVPREQLLRLDFERLDPSDTIDSFEHRGDVTASRKTGRFTAIVPFSSSELAIGAGAENLDLLLSQLRSLRAQICEQIEEGLVN